MSCLIFSFNSIGQSIVKGIILDTKGKPVPYATIFLKISKSGSVSNEFGSFSVKTKNGFYDDTLIISSIGFSPFKKSVKLLIILMKNP